MSATPRTVQQPRRGNVTRLCSEGDLRTAATVLAQQQGRLHAKLTTVERKLDALQTDTTRLIAILQSISSEGIK